MKSQTEITTLYVNPVPRISAQGRHKQTFTIQQKTGEFIPTVGMQKTREFGVASEYSFPYNHVSNRLVTGLDKMVPNPFKNLEPTQVIEDYSLSQDWLSILENIIKQDNIKLQTKYEIQDRVPYNTYTDEIAGGMTIFNTPASKLNTTIKPNFLQTYKIILYDKPNRFTDETPRGKLAIALIKIHPRIAASKNVANASVHDWYISEEKEAQIEKLQRQDLIDNATYEWVNLKRTGSPYTIYKLGCLLTWMDNRPVIKGTVNDETVRNFISDYINDSSSAKMEYISRFMKMVNLLNDKDGGTRFDIMYLVQQAINTDVIKVTDGYYVWHSKVGTPNMYKHSDYDRLISLLQKEFNNYNPEDRTITNWYRDLLEEVLSKGIWIE